MVARQRATAWISDWPRWEGVLCREQLIVHPSPRSLEAKQVQFPTGKRAHDGGVA